MLKKKVLLILLSLISIAFSAFGLVACGGEEITIPPLPIEDDTPKYYTIMYNDGEELTVQYGKVFKIDASKLPKEREGYEFLGYYDAEIGGSKYVNTNGMCTGPYTDKKDVVLYARFAPLTITLQLNYGKSVPTGFVEQAFEYEEELPDLPANLIANESKKFTFDGWYTEADCGGKKITNADGVVDLTVAGLLKKINGTNTGTGTNTSTSGGRTVKLYAGFSITKYKVTFYDCENYSTLWSGYDRVPIAESMVEYGTELLKCAPKTRKNGKQIFTWSSAIGANNTYNESITGDIELYVREYEVTLSYNSQGGNAVESVTGSNKKVFTLDNSVKRTYYEFLYWAGADGRQVSSGTYFATDTTLSANWAKVSFVLSFDAADERGVKMGKSLSLPSPNTTPKGYSFVGWVLGENTYAAEETFTPDADTSFTASYVANEYVVSFNSDGGGAVSSKSVTYDKSFTLPVPTVKEGVWRDVTYKSDKKGNTNTVGIQTLYTFGGWFTGECGSGSRLTDRNGKSVGAWSIDRDTTACAYWMPLTVRNYSDPGIETRGEGHNIYLGAVNFSALIGFTVEELKALGYTKIFMNLFFTIHETDDGYQEFYVCSSRTGSPCIWKKTDSEHTYADTDKTSWTHLFQVDVPIDEFANTIYIFGGTHGAWGNGWVMESMDIYLSAH